MEYILIFISAIFVNNIVLSQFLGICPFLGVSKKVETALGMSAAVAFVLTIATIVTFLIQKYVLDAFDLGYLQTITFILVIAALVQMGEIILKKYSPIGELSAFAKQYAESLSQMLGCLAGICDMDQVVAAAGNGKKELQDEDITRELGEFLKERKTQNAKAGEKKYVPVVSKTEPYSQEVISPILCAGDVIGAVLLLNMDQKDLFEEREICLAEYTAKVLGKQMEQ